ncbi:hypothetical protein NPS49_05830 [Pseudomonas putida]|uniref:ABC-three component system middle component 1 n=1 Tax=Pseudomonas putida TaxID=303 RepID=UPI002363324A|nr:ABC-three component system middle component 1 [Pseudomonas putida]MDD2067840.1 hypothetical protein [Pseudomonas putida]HDS1738275.1 hypothetical protein [Pseudomonas putida]
MMKLQQLIAAVGQRVEGRYEIQLADDMGLPEVEYPSQILRLKRARLANAGWRTVLLIELPSPAVQAAHQWAANIRDVLPEPETSDLYMFLVLQDTTHDEATRIETDDRFCRKVVVRQQETPMEFLDRTFLAALDPPGDVEKLSDPLAAAFQALSSAQTWTRDHIDFWKMELLSSTNGADVARSLRASMAGSEDQQ